MAGSSAIVVRLIGDATDLRRGLDQAQSGMEKFKKRVQLAATGIAVAGVAAGKAAVSAAADQSAAISAWTQVTGKAMDKQQKDIARSLNLSQTDYAKSFTTLSSLYQSNGLAIDKANEMAAKGLKLAADQAAFGNTTVGEAVEAQAGLLKGSGELLEKYAISITAADVAARMKADGTDKLTGAELKAATATAKANLVMEQSAKFAGQAGREANSLESRNQRLAATFDDMKAAIGARLLPIVEQVIGKFQAMADWVEQNQTKAKILAIAIGGLAGAILLGAAAIKAYEFALTVARGAVQLFWAANTALNFVMNANPAVRVTLILVALAAVFVLLWKRCETFRNIVTAAFNAVRNAAAAAFGWVRDHWGLILKILTGPIGLAVRTIAGHWDAIKSGAARMRDGIASVFSGIASVITAPFRAAVDGVRNIWNSTLGGKGFSVPDWVPGIFGGKGFTIPRLAKGGTVTADGWVQVGERGPEFLNLGRGAQVRPLDNAPAGGGDVHVTVMIDGQEFRGMVRHEVRESNRATRRDVLAGSGRR